MNVWPATVSVPARAHPEFEAIVYVAVPLPVPEPVTVIQDALLEAVQAHPEPFVTAMVPPPEPALVVAAVGLIEEVPLPAACVTVNVCPAIVSEPERPVQLGFAATE